MARLNSTNPAQNYELIGSVDISTEKEIKERVDRAQEAKKTWKEIGIRKRVTYLQTIYDEFLKNKEKIIDLIIQEVGKTRRDAISEFERYGNNFKWFLENGEKSLSDEITFEDEKTIHKIIFEPFGVAAVIIPWNHPFGMFIWGVIPNLIAGNTVVLKHSEECPLTGKLIEEIIKHILPEGVFSEIYGGGETGAILLKQDINLIWFTGSSQVGKIIYKTAANKFIKAVLEMGGSNPGIVFDDADLDQLVEKVYAKRFLTCGQTCDALKRLIVHESQFDYLVKRLKEVVEKKVVGDPQDLETDFGSLSAKRQLELLDSQVKDAVKKGATVVTGGKMPEGLKGAYYQPTILTNIKKNMRVWNEEVFGPVLIIVPFKSEEEAVELANDTPYGLGSLVFTKNKERALRVASKIESGTVEINLANHWLSCNPFGGYKESGMGREHGRQGFQELTQTKVVSLEK